MDTHKLVQDQYIFSRHELLETLGIPYSARDSTMSIEWSESRKQLIVTVTCTKWQRGNKDGQ